MQRILDESTKHQVKMRSEEAERMLKSRKYTIFLSYRFKFNICLLSLIAYLHNDLLVVLLVKFSSSLIV